MFSNRRALAIPLLSVGGEKVAATNRKEVSVGDYHRLVDA